MTARLHIDVTASWNRRAPPHGISRIVTELARAVRDLSEEHQAWRYDHRAQRMRPVSWEALERSLQRDGPDTRDLSVWARRLLRRSALLRLVWRAGLALLGRLSALAPGRRFPAFGPDDCFIYADVSNDDGRVATYRKMIETTGVSTLFYCHDLIPILFEGYVGSNTARCFTQLLRTLLEAEARILCNSEATLRDLGAVAGRMGFAGVDGRVIPPGCDLRRTDREAQSLPGFERAYILYVSTIEVRKNHRLLLRVYDRLMAQGWTDLPMLVFAGYRGWLVEDLLAEIDGAAGAAALVRIVENQSDEEIAALYRGALFTVYPSLYEGWGIPVSESLALGTFCLSSDRGALPEAGAGLTETLDPEDEALWADRIAHYLRDRDELRRREARIRSHFHARSWSDFREDVKVQLLD
ncbi:glycosyltransferase [Sphingosinicella rhizophila]|uniref:Glycosyltransferase n=1 Tax=Sphingosinicella rhizophila TaxID=3050082 RepID=A0ABU3Q4Q0_9SPHN|nr:glycosyltransferase [Sphingosinicella sp. GR2756]MDT9598262.1 glycosyltransferase [Sphingosinicella sp. GR2756]